MAEGGTGRGTEVRNQAKRTHTRETEGSTLETAGGEISQDTERKQLKEKHPPSGEIKERNKSGHGRKATEQGALTAWRR